MRTWHIGNRTLLHAGVRTQASRPKWLYRTTYLTLAHY